VQSRCSNALVFGLFVAIACRPAPEPPPPPSPPPPDHAEPIGPQPLDRSGRQTEEIRRGDSLSTSLGRLGVGPLEVDALARALDGLLDVTKSRVGDQIEALVGEGGELRWFRYVASPEDIYVAARDEEDFIAWREYVPVQIETELVEGTVEISLYLAMEAIGELPWLTLTLADIFAWDIDFFTEPRVGDRFRLLVEKKSLYGELIGYGDVLAAEYAQVDGDVFRAFRYEFEDGRIGYYRADGVAVEKMFLKSPVKFATITSRFGMRHHPVLNYRRAHKGVDYGAPRGTGVWAVGDGVVTMAGRRGGYGRLVEIRHKNGLKTRYAHLNGYARGIRAGVRVRQKQLVGYVGSSGLATGPHLHFEVLRGGRHTNPLTLVVPPAPPIDAAEMPRFQAAVAPVVARLGDTPIMASTAESSEAAATLESQTTVIRRVQYPVVPSVGSPSVSGCSFPSRSTVRNRSVCSPGVAS
jgi:murein DD-endopeptidase MepM/ murein hydrolase activator NlpD